MKLHLPIALLTAVICAVSFAQGASEGTFTIGNGTYTYETDKNGAVTTTFNGIGDGGYPSEVTTNKTGWGGKGQMGGLAPDYSWEGSEYARTASSVTLILGDGVQETTGVADTTAKVAAGIGFRGYDVTGEKKIIIKQDAWVNQLAGSRNWYSGHNSGYDNDTQGTYPPKHEGGSISFDVQGYVTQLYGGDWGSNVSAYSTLIKETRESLTPKHKGNTTKVEAEMKKFMTENPAWAINDDISININGGKVGVDYDGDVLANPTNGVIYGAGQAGFSTNGDVEISLTNGAEVYGTIYGTAATTLKESKEYVISYAGNTTISVSGDSMVTGSIIVADSDGGVIKGNAKVVVEDGSRIGGSIIGGKAENVTGDRILAFHNFETNNNIEKYIAQASDFNAVEFKDVADVDFDDNKFDRFDTLYVAGSNPDKPTVVTTDAGREFRKIHVQEGGQLDMGNAKGETSKYILTGTGVALEEALVVDGTMNVDNAHLVIQGTNSQLGIGYNSNNAVMNVVNSRVDMTGTSTVHMGYYNGKGGTLNIEKGSTFIGGANNAWLGGGEINVVGGSSMEVCSTQEQYNYRTILGMSGNTLDLNIKDHSSFTSKATQFITNYNSDTTVNITVDGEGSILYQTGKTESKGSSYVIGTSGEWVTEEITKSDGTTTTVWRDKDTKGSVAGANKDDKGNPLPSDTITYIASAGTNAVGELYGTVNNAHTTITAENGGKVQIDSARTYVGDVRDHATYGKDLNKSATFNVGKDSSMSFKKLDIYANTNVNFTESEGSAAGTFKTTGVNLNKGAELNITGTAEHKGNFELNGGGMYIYGGVVNVNSANVDLSNGGTLSMGYYGEADSRLNITNGSDFKGASQNAWLGAGEVNVSGGSSLTVCTGNGTVNNYRVLMGLREDNLVESSTIKLNVTEGSSFKSEASRFVTNYHSNTEVNITVDGEGSTFTQVAEARVVNATNPNKHMEDTITYLLARGVDNNGELPYMPESSNDYRNGIVNNVSTTITATNGGKIDFQSSKTYIGFAKDKEVFDGRGETMNKKATFNVGAGSSLSFKDVEVYANIVVNNNGGTFKAGEMNINNGGQLTFNVNTASAVMTAEKLTVYTGGTLSFVQPAAAEGTSLAMEAPATTTVTLDSDLVLLAGSTLVLDPGMLVNLGYNDLTIQDGATIVLGGTAAALTMTDAEVATLFQTAGIFTALDADGNIKADGIASVTFNGSTVGISVGNGVVANVPEPTTATLSLLALAGLCARRRRK